MSLKSMLCFLVFILTTSEVFSQSCQYRSVEYIRSYWSRQTVLYACRISGPNQRQDYIDQIQDEFCRPSYRLPGPPVPDYTAECTNDIIINGLNQTIRSIAYSDIGYSGTRNQILQDLVKRVQERVDILEYWHGVCEAREDQP